MAREFKYLMKLKLYNSRLSEVMKYSNLQTSIEQILKTGVVPIIRKNLNYVKQSGQELINKSNIWYTKFLGLDEVKFYQQRVVDLQEKLLDIQEHRREISKQLSDVRSKSNEIQDQIHKVKRHEDLQRYLNLMQEDAEVLKQELMVTAAFNNYDRQEREVFTAYINAVKDSHEKQRSQLEYTKYFGLILSVVGSFLTFCYSTIKKRDLQRFIEENMLISNITSGPILKQLQDNEKNINTLVKYMDNNKQVTQAISNNYLHVLQRLNMPAQNQYKIDINKDLHSVENLSQNVNGFSPLTRYCITAIVGYIILKTIIG